MSVLAIDPGPADSAWVILDGAECIARFGKSENAYLVDGIMTKMVEADYLVVEKIASYGMPVGEEVFETVYWSGRFCQAHYAHLRPGFRIPRMRVKMHLCHHSNAKDGNIRQALIDRFGGPSSIKKGGPLYKVSGDVWAALAVGVTWWDERVKEDLPR